MIEFEDWFRQIVTTSELLASKNALERTWLQGDKTITSIVDFGELYEQVFGDLDSRLSLASFAPVLEPRTRVAVENLLSELSAVDSLIERRPTLKSPSVLLASPAWARVREAAKAVIDLPSARPWRSARRDIVI